MEPRAPLELRRVVESYIADVQTGALVVGRLERLAVERHLRDVEEGEARGLRFDWQPALRALWWIEHRCRFTKGERAGEPFLLEPWQAFIVASLFGWLRHIDGRWLRRFRTAYICIARKNGKTELVAAIGLLLLTVFGEPGGEVYSAATKRDQAKICWSAAARMVQKNRALKRDLVVTTSRNIIAHPGSDSTFEALSADADTMDGLSPHCAIVDELHAHATGETWDVLKSGMGARREPLQVAITTAGGQHEGICWEIESDAVRILDRVVDDDTVFAYIARLDDGDDFANPAVWRKANPNLGVSVASDYLATQVRTARNNPGRVNEVKRKNFNLWTDTATVWMPIERWDRCNGPVDLEVLRDRPCFIGVDLSATIDTTAITAAWALADGTFAVKARVFVPADTIESRTPRERDLFRQWAARGLITLTEGDLVDYEAIWLEILNLCERFSVQQLVFDRWQSGSLVARAEQTGIEVVGFGQGYKDMSPAVKFVEHLVGHRRLAHGGDPVLRWNIANVAVQMDPAGNVKPNKKKSASRIDAAVAAIMALARAGTHQEAQPFILAVEA